MVGATESGSAPASAEATAPASRLPLRAGPPHSTAHAAKFRQAAFVYLHVGILYLAAVWVVHQQGMLPPGRGPIGLWLVLGAAITGAVFAGLWWWRNVWVARIIWALHALRVPALLEGAFFPDADAALSPAFYLTALVVVLVNLWMLARAGWNL